MTPLDQRPHALYRFFNTDGVLMYIGITADIPTRFRDHSRDKPWWHEVARIAVEPFADRPSVLAAEKRAIKAEQPLWNDAHAVKPPGVPAAADRLIAVCFGCDSAITGSAGVVHVNMREVERARETWKRAEPTEDRPWTDLSSMLLTRSDLGQLYEAPWLVHCDDCNPHQDDEGALCGNCYWFNVDNVQSHRDLLERTAHLLEKNWLKYTDWDDFIGRVARGHWEAGFKAVKGGQ